ncbi:MAG: DoxX family protein [Ktedonobacteraceae bacterium]
MTPLAASGLVITMFGAIILHFRLKEMKLVGGPLILLLLALFIVIGRFVAAPIV